MVFEPDSHPSPRRCALSSRERAPEDSGSRRFATISPRYPTPSRNFRLRARIHDASCVNVLGPAGSFGRSRWLRCRLYGMLRICCAAASRDRRARRAWSQTDRCARSRGRRSGEAGPGRGRRRSGVVSLRGTERRVAALRYRAQRSATAGFRLCAPRHRRGHCECSSGAARDTHRSAELFEGGVVDLSRAMGGGRHDQPSLICVSAPPLRKSPLTSAAAIPLGARLGGTTTMFSASTPVLLRPLPFAVGAAGAVSATSPMRRGGSPTIRGGESSPADFLDYRASSIFDGLASVSTNPVRLSNDGTRSRRSPRKCLETSSGARCDRHRRQNVRAGG